MVETEWTQELSARRIGTNEAIVRYHNEKISEAAERLEVDDNPVPFICECGRLECVATLRVTLDEYEAVREDGRLFLCLPGHELVGRDIGRVVDDSHEGFVLVEKIGTAGEVAERLDPRPG